MSYSASNYRDLFLKLLPRGGAWVKEIGTTLYEFFSALAEELHRVDVRMEDLLRERHTLTTAELLTDHELDLGIPDECVDLADSLDERRIYANTKLTYVGGQSKVHFIELAQTLGYTVTITEFSPFIAGLGFAGAPVHAPEMIYYWMVTVNLADPTVIYFTAGSSGAGDLLAYFFGLEILKCVFEKYKPAHTHIIWDYDGPEYGRGFDRSFDSLPSDAATHLNGSYNGYEFSSAFDLYYGGPFDENAFDSGFAQPK